MIWPHRTNRLRSAIEGVLQPLMVSILSAAFLGGCTMVGPDW